MFGLHVDIGHFLPAHFPEQDPRVGGGDEFVVNDPGLPQPLVRLRQGDVVAVVTPGHPKLGKGHELVLETSSVPGEPFQRLGPVKLLCRRTTCLLATAAAPVQHTPSLPSALLLFKCIMVSSTLLSLRHFMVVGVKLPKKFSFWGGNC